MALNQILTPWDSQPQEVVGVDQGFSAPVRFAYLPSVGLVNLANGQTANEIGTVTTSAIQSGIAYTGGVIGYPRNISLANGATFISIWRAGTQYFGADGARRIISNQKSGNNGFSWGRHSAVGGGATGNLTAQRLTFHGIADYTEANSTIESYVDTPVACRYNKTTGAISWFRFGVKSSADTAGSTSPGSGFQIVVGGQGDFASATQLWIDRAHALVVFEGALSDAEIFDLTNSVRAVWSAFAPRSIWVPITVASGVGRLYYVIGPSAGWSTPTAAEIMAGQLSGGSPATASGNEISPTVTTDPFTFSADATGLTPGTNYRVAYVWSDA